jgi:hypothetical protein
VVVEMADAKELAAAAETAAKTAAPRESKKVP